jgi:succinyl-diaminopimelate desuccinylase
MQQLVRIDSQNPGSDEAEIARFTQKFLAGCSVKSRIYEFKKNRSNLVAVIPGKNRKRSLLISPHLDTVPCGGKWKFPPFSAKVSQGKIYGLGATDCKANLAVSLEVIRSLTGDKTKLDYDLVFAGTADEECGSALGLIPLLDKRILKPQAALILDADDFDIVVAQKGLLHMKVKLSGKRAHGAYPHKGINAIEAAVQIIREVKENNSYSFRNKYLRPPTVNIGTIKGGDKVNIVADWCEFEVDFRFLPGMRAEDFIAKLKTIIRKHIKKFKIEIDSIQQPYVIAESHYLVSKLKQAMQNSGIRPELKGSEGATVITFFQHKKIPAVASGFGCSGCAHSVNEYVKISNLYKGAQVLEEFLKNY